MKFLLDFCKGIMIGAGAILPGISSGVLCVAFGIYDKLLDSVLNFFKDISKNIKFLLPIILGGLVGIILFSNVLQYLLYKYSLQIKSLFIGLILGGTNLLFRQITSKEKIKFKNMCYLLISLIIGIMMVYFENRIGVEKVKEVNYIYLIFSGFLMSIGIIVPGVSNTIILMMLGIYPLYLSSVSTLYWPVLIPMIIGIAFGCLIFMKIIKYLLDNFYSQTMYIIIGFTIGSIFILLPDIQTITEILIAFLCTILGYFVTKNFII